MSVPPLRLGNNFDSYISGEVIIHPSAAIAPGVILQATPNGKIIIGSGVCIGMGSILQVEQGTLEIAAGANLGAGFLMVGEGKIGENACIGSATTVFHCSVERGKIIAPGSILGDNSRAIAKSVSETEKTLPPPSSTTASPGLSLETTGEEKVDIEVKIETKTVSPPVMKAQLETENVSQPEVQAQLETTTTEQPDTSTEQVDTSTEKEENSEPAIAPPENFGAHIYGQGSIQQLLITLFPHRQSLNKPVSDDRPD
ncbi:MAG: transferase [Calothrix sp. MO_192.B10]|nr:transferase [Calothrix sp. MO_192.B10]